MTIKKEFLDFLYEERAAAIRNLDAARKRAAAVRAGGPALEALNAPPVAVSALEHLDEIIEAYLNTHGKE